MTPPSALSSVVPDLGDPWDAGNPLNYAAVLAADEAGEPFAAGEERLRAAGLHRHFVPASLGGEFRGADEFARTMRAVFRRDAGLGVGYGATSFIAAVPVWTAGSPEQRRAMAEVLLAGGRCAAAFTELDHGADFARADVAARPAGDGWRVSGAKHLINNVARADLVTLFARTDERPGSRSHSNLLVDMRGRPAADYRLLSRYRTSGMRGCLLGGIEFTDAAVPAGAVIGRPGEALETVFQAFQITRCVLPGMVIGILDSQLRLAMRYARGRRLYGQAVADLPHTRTVLAGAFVDLLIADCLATVGARTLHLLPGEGSVLSAAVKHLVPKLLQEAGYELSTLLGASYYLREGEHAAFGKHARDLPVAVLAHASSAVCLSTIIPQLPRLARRGWTAADAAPPPAALFRPGDLLGELEPDRLAVHNRGQDSLTALLRTAPDWAGDGDVRRHLEPFVTELAALGEKAGLLGPRDQTVAAGRDSFTLAHRYSVVLAAAACAGIWREHAADDFLGDPAWLVSALQRLRVRLDRAARPIWTATAAVPSAVYDELSHRYDQDRCFDLAG
ncbi:acyl-CoA dehydrogenase [Paractinoplanes rishiriensis]|uniref:Isovaleryl-CoA dehydrogenase n=1 Tax=Paractinoplanes rishiriensis TaxID=1050105 RepID=A0A919KA49_9ACTN|nr:acyl-CoA dehydrogenase [Actinoplanes rishiriensis]GIF02273.1 isovaleryl-CoA dehydrogenase [Actinoplanes rishiriensis]